MELKEIRARIDEIDEQLVGLFNERLDLAPRIVERPSARRADRYSTPRGNERS